MLVQEEPRSQTRIQSVRRAVGLLLAVAESPDGLTAKALAEQFDLSLPTAYHLLTTLWAEGMLTKDDFRVFRLGKSAAVIAEAYQRLDTVPAAYRDALHQIARTTGETAYLGAWRNNGVQVLDTAEGVHAVRVVGLDVGYNEDVHARASGKLFMAFGPEEVVASIIDRGRLRRLTPHTITKKSDLQRELADIKKTGLSFDREELQLGVKCVSAPIWRAGKVVACITVSAPTSRYEETEEQIIAALVSVTSRLNDR